jgi:hypothetical protein
MKQRRLRSELAGVFVGQIHASRFTPRMWLKSQFFVPGAAATTARFDQSPDEV